MYSSSSFPNSTFHLVPLPSILYGPFLPHIILKIDSSVSSSSSLFFVSSCSSELFSSEFVTNSSNCLTVYKLYVSAGVMFLYHFQKFLKYVFGSNING